MNLQYSICHWWYFHSLFGLFNPIFNYKSHLSVCFVSNGFQRKNNQRINVRSWDSFYKGKTGNSMLSCLRSFILICYIINSMQKKRLESLKRLNSMVNLKASLTDLTRLNCGLKGLWPKLKPYYSQIQVFINDPLLFRINNSPFFRCSLWRLALWQIGSWG